MLDLVEILVDTYNALARVLSCIERNTTFATTGDEDERRARRPAAQNNIATGISRNNAVRSRIKQPVHVAMLSQSQSQSGVVSYQLNISADVISTQRLLVPDFIR